MTVTNNEITCCGKRLSSADIEVSDGQLCEDDDCNYVLETTVLTITCPICGEEKSEGFFMGPEDGEDLLTFYLREGR